MRIWPSVLLFRATPSCTSIVVGALLVAACGDSGGSRNDAGSTGQDTAMGQDASPGAGSADAASSRDASHTADAEVVVEDGGAPDPGVDANAGDGAVDGGGGTPDADASAQPDADASAQPDAEAPAFVTNTPNVAIRSVNAPIAIAASALLKLTTTEGEYVHWLVRLRNDGSERVCASGLTGTFRDQDGVELLQVGATVASPTYPATFAGFPIMPQPCIPPGGRGVAMGATSSKLDLSVLHTLDVAVTLPAASTVVGATSDLQVENLVVDSTAPDNPVFRGVVHNTGGALLQGIIVYLLALDVQGIPVGNARWDAQSLAAGASTPFTIAGRPGVPVASAEAFAIFLL
jgi:hypothetical protein